MRLLLVDDEYESVEGIRCSQDWEALGIDEVQAAYSMRQAQEALLAKTADIVLCDVEMPRGTGIDLLFWAKEQGMELVSILLTGFAVFNYAKQAIELGCIDYLLKPAPVEQLAEALRRAVSAVEEKQRNRKNQQWISQWDAQSADWEERFWKLVVDGQYWEDDSKLRQNAGMLQIRLDTEEQYLAVLMKVYEKKEKWTEFGEQLEGLTKRYFLEDQDVVLVREADLKCFLIFRSKMGWEEKLELVRGRCHQMLEDWQGISGYSLACYIGRFEPVSRLHQSCMDLLEFMKENVGQFPGVFALGEEGVSYRRTRLDGDAAVERVKRYIQNHLEQELTRQQMAELVYLSQDYLARIFHQKTGIPLSEYIIRARMEKGRKLLETTGMSVNEIALAVGYVNPAYFIKVFRERYGETPRKYREKACWP